MTEDGLKLTAWFGERDRSEDRPLAEALLEIFARHRLRASVLLRGAEGFGEAQRQRTDRLLSLSDDLPAMASAVDSRERIQAALTEVAGIRRPGLVTVQQARLLSGRLEPLRLRQPSGDALKLTLYVGRRQRAAGRPAHEVICELMHRRGLAGATVLLGVDGTWEGKRARARFLSGNGDTPMIVVAIGDSGPIAALLPELWQLLPRPLASLERVRVCKRDGQLLARPQELSDRPPPGRPPWQKLTVFSSQAALAAGRPLSLELVRRLRGSGAAGATNLRGVWGFHGDAAPHGDRLLQIRRHVPVVTVALDTPAGIAASFAIVDELTAESGLVISELLPAPGATA